MSNTPRGYILIDLSNLDAEFDIDQFLNQNLIKIDADVVAINDSLQSVNLKLSQASAPECAFAYKNFGGGL